MPSRIFCLLLCAVITPLSAAPREAEWPQVDEAIHNDQPQTAADLLRPLETAAFAAKDWGKGTRAMALRIALDAKPKGGLLASLKEIAAEIPAAPPEVKPMLRLLQAQWMFSYYSNNRGAFANRSSLGSNPGSAIETWDLGRILTEIDRCFQDSLADKEALRKTPVNVFDGLLETGGLGDALRPTLYDFIAHAAIGFYASEEAAAAKPGDTFEIDPAAALDTTDAFLAWHPGIRDETSPNFRALRLYQDLLEFHRADRDPTAFLHCDLERIRWAGAVAPGAKKSGRLEAALRAFVSNNAGHPISADARLSLVNEVSDKDHTKEAHEIAKAGADAFPDHAFGKLCKDVVNDFETRQIWPMAATHWTHSGEEITVNHSNVSRIWFRAYRYQWQADNAMECDPTPCDGGDDNDAKMAALLRTESVKSWDAPLPDDHDYAPRTSRLPAPTDLPPGYYIIVSSGDASFRLKNNRLSMMSVRVTSLAMVMREECGKHTGLVTDAVTGAPRAGVEVRFYYPVGKDEELATGSATTDANGWFALPSIKTERSRILAVAGSGNDTVVVRPGGFYTRGDATVEDMEQEPSDRIVIFTDRAIYRPGQVISFKGIWCHSDYKTGDYRTLAGKKTTVVFHKLNGGDIQQIEVTTNERGSFSGTFTAPTGGLNGIYAISAEPDGGASFSIEEYKRPKFSAAIQAPADPVAVGGQVVVRGEATAFTGAPIDGAVVNWRVTRTTRWPDWMRWSGFTPDRIGTSQIALGSATTAADGSFTIAFPAAPDTAVDPATDPEFTYQIVADVTDASGETCSVHASVVAAHTAFKVSVATDDWLVADKPFTFHVRTMTPNEDPRPAEGLLRIFKLIQPAVCARGGKSEEVYRDCDATVYPPGGSSNPAKWPTGDQAAELVVRTNPDDRADSHRGEADVAASLSAGAYRAVWIGNDAKGRKVQARCDFQVFDPTSDKFPTRMPFFTAYDSEEIEPGHPFTLVWGSGHPLARACVEWYKDNTLIKREWSAPGRTQQVFSLTPDESMRGGFCVRVTQLTLNCHQNLVRDITVPWSNKELELRWEHITSKLQPGARETWTAVITGPGGVPADVEMAATLYDASLDAIRAHSDPGLVNLFRYDMSEVGNDAETADDLDDSVCYWSWDTPDSFRLEHPYRIFQDRGILQTGYEKSRREVPMIGFQAEVLREMCYSVPPVIVDPFSPAKDSADSPDASAGDGGRRNKPGPDFTHVTARRNLRETAFFYPHLTSNEKGEVRITFTMPEALTKWRFIGFAHDKNMRFGTLDGETVTAKALMVQPNPPRFLREGDVLDFTVKITNQSDNEQSGTACLTCCDAATQKDSTAALGITAPDQPWSIPAKESRVLSWRLTVPEGAGLLSYKALATSGTLSDGEEGWLPVIPRRVMLTESLALPIRDAGTKDYTFQKLLESGKSNTLENRLLDVQVVSQPAWYAVMALPYLMEFPHECAEQTFSRYYANALARHIAHSNPEIRRIIELWKHTPALDNPLAKNADLKGIVLEETPWLAEAAESFQARRNLALLFDDNRIDNELESTLKRLRDMQGSDGLWPWFPGGRGDEYITRYIVAGFARLRAAGVKTDMAPALKALQGMDTRLTEWYAQIQRVAGKDPGVLMDIHLHPDIAYQLYTRTLFLTDRPIAPADKQACDYFTAQAKKDWATLDSRMARAHVALALARLGDLATAKLITRSLRESAVISEENGMSWNDEHLGAWWWWQAPIETQAMMIEAFREIDHDDKAVDACQVWLIKQKQLRDWRTTKATADAIHALLMGGRNLLGSDSLLGVSLGGNPVKPEGVEPGTGFYESRIAGPAVRPEMGNIKLTKSDPGVAWASVHWQYIEDLAKVTPHDNDVFKLEKTLHVRRHTSQGDVLEPVTGPVNVGDELVTRLVLRNDGDLQYVHLKDQRGSGTEPVNTLSGYRSQDGFSYYEVTRDTASHFFIDFLPHGTHVFETSVRVQHAGIYQTGIAEIRCMYAPELNAHSASVKIEVGQ